MKITFRPITEENFEECIALKVREDQSDFIDTNLYSIAEAKVIPTYIVNCIYVAEVMVGFIMYRFDLEIGELYINRLMIDAKQQGKGYGRASLDLIKQIAQSTQFITKMTLSTDPKNTSAIGLYASFGFVDTGRLSGSEKVYELRLR